MKKIRKNLLVICMALVVALSFAVPQAIAALATLSQSFGTDDADEIDRAIYGNTVTFLGTRLRGPLKREASDIVATGALDTTIDPDDRVVFFTTAAVGLGIGEDSLADSVAGHQLTLVLETDGGGNVDITPNTSTGFSSIQLNDAKDSCTIEYANDTDGWFLVSNNGCTIN